MPPFLNEIWVWVTAHASGLTAVAALATSLFALRVSTWSRLQNRRHNILSVQPDLVFELKDDEDMVKLLLSNNGLGPAKVDDMKVYYGEKLMTGENVEKIFNALTIIFPNDHVRREGNRATYLDAGVSISPNKPHDLVRFRLAHWKHDDVVDGRDKIRKHLNIIIKYKCLYGKNFEANF